jgi:signal transduction histidine kinase
VTNSSRPDTAVVPLFITLVFTACMATLIGNAMAFTMNILAMSRSSDYVEQTLTVLKSLEEIQSLILDGEAGQRGYLLTGEKKYLEPYFAAENGHQVAAQKIATLITDNSRLQAELKQLETLIDDKLQEMRATIAVRDREGYEVAVAMIYTDVGKNTMDRIRSLIRSMEQEQNQAFTLQGGEARQRAGITVGVSIISSLLAMAVLTLFYVLIKRNLAKRRAAEQALRDTNDNLAAIVDQKTAQLSSLSRYLLRVSEAEKAKLARELHDELGSSLTAINMDVGWVNEKLKQPSPDLSRRLERALAVLHATVDIKRRIIEDLRPSMLDSLGLSAALQAHCEDFSRRSGVPCTAEVAEDPGPVDPDRAIAIFRIAQEALTNTARHAQAKGARVALTREANGLRLSVQDDGIGIAPDALSKAKSHGLIGMRERVMQLGGVFAIRNGENRRGTIVEAFVPFSDRPSL